MPYLIDGHNLINHVLGLSLDQIDDELALVNLLAAYFQRLRKHAVIYFDKAQPGEKLSLTRSFLEVHFVRPPAIADTAILQHLNSLGGEARNWTVVSSDGEVRQGAQKYGAEVLSSAEFSARLDSSSEKNRRVNSGSEEATSKDTQFWLDRFNRRQD